MDDALVHYHVVNERICDYLVLILVLMDDALVHEYDHYTAISFDVLILVLMDDALVRYYK